MLTYCSILVGDLLPESTLEKLYAMVFMPLAATTLAATVERFEKLGIISTGLWSRASQALSSRV